jgi:hypothetical protein
MPVGAGGSPFLDVPQPPSDQESVLAAVRAYKPMGAGDVLDEVDIQGKQAKVRYRSKASTASQVFSLVRQNGGWKVQKVE